MVYHSPFVMVSHCALSIEQNGFPQAGAYALGVHTAWLIAAPNAIQGPKNMRKHLLHKYDKIGCPVNVQ